MPCPPPSRRETPGVRCPDPDWSCCFLPDTLILVISPKGLLDLDANGSDVLGDPEEPACCRLSGAIKVPDVAHWAGIAYLGPRPAHGHSHGRRNLHGTRP